jgi:hypothetical protein
MCSSKCSLDQVAVLGPNHQVAWQFYVILKRHHHRMNPKCNARIIEIAFLSTHRASLGPVSQPPSAQIYFANVLGLQGDLIAERYGRRAPRTEREYNCALEEIVLYLILCAR